MTATDELRRLLDERGAEYTVIPEDMYGSREYIKIGSTEIRTNGLGEVDVFYLTPEQAVEATLGMGACRVVRSIRHDYEGGYAGTEYEHVLSCGHKTWWGNDDSPDYCPWCGRKVVDA